MCLMENQHGMLETKQIMTASREVYISVIDQISKELYYQFDELNMELLSFMSALNPS